MQRVIGIDPDLVKSGVGIVENGELIDLKALPLFELVDFIKANQDALFVLEDVETLKPVFNKRGVKTQQAKLKVAQNVGQVKGACRFLKEALAAAGVEFVLQRPLVGYAKKAKKDAKFFNQITGWEGQSNEDKRDAALLALYVSKRRVSA